jgi:SAM-dependent methyltransferase
MTTSPDAWVYGDFAPDPHARDLPGLKAAWIVAQLPPGESPAVLDYGAGEGKHLRLIRGVRPRARLVGVDIRPVHSNVDFEFHRIDADASLPFPADHFDVIVSCDVLEHVESLDRSLEEIHRVMRPGASFIGFVPAEGGLGPHGLFRLLDRDIYRHSKDHNQNYTRRELLRRFSERFEVVRVAYSYHLLGATLDAVFFASFKAPLVGASIEALWRGQENAVYRGRLAGQSRPSLPGRLIQFASRAAYLESKILKNVPLTAKGVHFHLRKRPQSGARRDTAR